MVKETADRRGVSVSGRGPKWSRIPYREDPDYTKPLLEIPAEARERMFARLRFIPQINTTWWSTINRHHNQEDMALQVKRYLASRSIALVLQGVPSVYTHGAIGSSNDHDLMKKNNVKRDVNRAVINVQKLMEEAKDPRSKISRLARQWPKLSLTRTGQRAFHPHGDQKVLTLSPQVFTVLRTSPEGDENILTMTNVANKQIDLEISVSEVGVKATQWFDLVSEREYDAASGKLSVTLEPYDVVWVKGA